MKYKLDLGLDGGGGGPWLSWHPQASRNGDRSPNTWSLRSADGEVTTTDIPSRGFILDLEMIRTGWESASGRAGVAPERRWNATADHYEPQPGPDWKRSFSLPCAFSKTQRVTWEQASLAARIALDDLCKVLDADPVDHGEQVPYVRQTGTKLIRTAGGNTTAPILTLVKWVDRPDVLDQPDEPPDERIPGHLTDQVNEAAEPDVSASPWDEPQEPEAPPEVSSTKLRAEVARRHPAQPGKLVKQPLKRAIREPVAADLDDAVPF